MLYILTFENYLSANRLKGFTMGSFQSKKNQVKIKNLLPKRKEFSYFNTSGEITLKKDVDFDILCFEINLEGHYLKLVCLWPQNHSTAPPTPVVSDLSSADSDYDC